MTQQQFFKRLLTSLVIFGKYIMPTIFNLKTPQVHQEISDALLDDSIKKLNIIAPRGIAKSTLAVVALVLHHLMFTKGRKVVVIVSRTQGHAKNLLQTIKDVLEYSEPFRKLFGYWGPMYARKWTSEFVTLKDGSAIVCKGAGQQLRGLNIGGQRPTLVIIDDPEDEVNTKNDQSIEENLMWLLQSAVPCVDAKKGRIVVIGTPLNARSMVMMLKQMDDWKTLHYHYLMKGADGKPYSIWPEMKSVEELLRERKSLEGVGREHVWWKERQCMIKGGNHKPFKPEYMRLWDGQLMRRKGEWYLRVTRIDNVYYKENPLIIPVNVFMGVDPASSTNPNADYSVVFPAAYDAHGNVYALPYFRERVTPMNLASNILKWFKRYIPHKTRIESVGYQEMLREYLRTVSEEKGIYIPGLEIKENPRTNKNKRLEGMEPLFARRKVYLMPYMYGPNEFYDELIMYPDASHDDTLDAFFYATKRIYKPWHDLSNIAEKKVEKQIEIYEHELDYDPWTA